MIHFIAVCTMMYRATSELSGASTVVRTLQMTRSLLEQLEQMPPVERRLHTKKLEKALRAEALDAFLTDLQKRPHGEREAAVDAWYAANQHTFRAQAERIVAEERS